MLKLILALGMVCVVTAGAADPMSRSKGGNAPSSPPPSKPTTPPPPPPPPPMPSVPDCWRDFLVGISACQHEFEGTDRIQVALRRTALCGAGAALNSCLNLVPGSFPATETPEAPIGSKPYSCLEQLMVDVKECRTKFSPGVVSQQADPDRDTMKNAFDQCLGGAMSKNGWCNGRKPNNPLIAARVNVLEGPSLAADKASVTVTVSHTADKPVNIYWFAAVFNAQSELVSEQRLGMTANVPAMPTRLTLPLSEVRADGQDIVVLGRTAEGDEPFGATGG